MRTSRTLLAAVVAVALSACAGFEDVSAGTTVTCSSASDCPGGRVCNRGRCIHPNAIDTTPPDLVPGSLGVTPPRVAANQPFTVTLQVTEPLESPPDVTLGLVPPPALACAAAGALTFSCSYTPSGAENAGLGGDTALNVHLRDAAGNDTFRSAVGSVLLDFVPPSPTVASVAYYPGKTNPLPAVRRATAGTAVRVAVSADERLSSTATPSLVARLGGVSLPFTLEPGGLGDHDALFVTTIAPGTPDGEYALEVTWADEVGNLGGATVPGATVQVKTSRPTLVVNQAAVVFVRSPGGNAAREPLGGYAIPAGPYFALEPAEPLSPDLTLPRGTFLLETGAVPVQLHVLAGSMTVGTLVPETGGTWLRKALASPDTFTVQVVGYDEAGNATDPQAIGTVEWVATSNPPPTGETPHTVRRTPLVEASRVQRTELDTVPDADVAGADGAGAIATTGAVWRKMKIAPATRPTLQAGVAYDAVRGRVVKVSGNLGSSSLQSVWEWDGSEWVDATPLGENPAARHGGSLAFDGARGRVVLFGGGSANPNAVYQDTWELDGTRWERRTPPASPPPRSQAALAYDSARRRVVLFGGLSDRFLDDTWEWDGATWTSVTPAGGTRPTARYGHQLAYDHARRRTVLWGGAADGLVWEWDGTAWSSRAASGPPSYDVAMVYAHNGESGRMLVLGGGGVWAWDGLAFSPVPWSGTFPTFYEQGLAAHDVARGRTVLATGFGASAGTAEFDGAWWQDVTATGTSPPPRYVYQNSMAYDPARRRAVLFGGGTTRDTWEWDGAHWRKVTPPGASPPGSAGLVHDPARGRTITRISGQVWDWDGALWTSVTETSNACQSGCVLAYDPVRGEPLGFGLGGTYAWNGKDWIGVASPGTNQSWLPVTDAANGRVILNAPGTGQLWIGNAQAWSDATPAGTVPPLRLNTAMAFDSERGRAILVAGGLTGGGVLADVWEWDGAAWRETTPPGAKPRPRRMHSLAYDSVRHRTVLFSGNDSGGDITWDDTWELEARPGGRPAIQFDASMTRTGIAPASVQRLRVRAYAGGRFKLADPGAAGRPGATLRGWTTDSTVTGPGGWKPLAMNDAGIALGPPASTLMDWQVASEEARRFITTGDGQLSFQVVPSGTMGNDPGGAEVALDYIEVRVRYSAL